MQELKKISLRRFYIIVVLESASSNFILPVTPTIIKNLGMPDYLFGVSYAGMSLAYFLFAPLWGKISGRKGTVAVYGVGCIGYALAQMMFCFSTTQFTIMAARIISGFFIGAINISHLAYLIDVSEKDGLGKNVIVMSTLASVSCTFGYLVGGVLGDHSILCTFMLQAAILSGCGIYLFLFLKDGREIRKEKLNVLASLKEINPFSAFLDYRNMISRMFLVLMSSFLLVYIASTACDQCFNYYIKDQFSFPPSYNGYLKALMGVITLALNITVCRRIVSRTKGMRPFGIILIFGAVSLLFVVAFSKVTAVFLTAYTLFFTFNSILVTLEQAIVSHMGDGESGPKIVALYNSIQSLGSVIGAAAAGLLYDFSSVSSFVFGLVLMAAAILLLELPSMSMKNGNRGKRIQANGGVSLR